MKDINKQELFIGDDVVIAVQTGRSKVELFDGYILDMKGNSKITVRLKNGGIINIMATTTRVRKL